MGEKGSLWPGYVTLLDDDMVEACRLGLLSALLNVRSGGCIQTHGAATRGFVIPLSAWVRLLAGDTVPSGGSFFTVTFA